MPTRPKLKRETRRKEGMPSKELLLVRLRVSGLGLEPRWLLNRFKNYIHDRIFKLTTKLIPFQVLDEAEGKEKRATVDASKAKEENLEVAGGKCWRGFWLSALNVTGEIFNQFPMEVICLNNKAEVSARNMLFQRQK